MANHWYVLRSKPHKESIVSQQIIAKGIEIYYPCLRVNPVNPRARKVNPYFPGYLFVNVNLGAVGVSVFQYMTYAIGLVSYGREPASVPEEFIYALTHRVNAMEQVHDELSSGFKRGDPILITEGPYVGYSALFDRQLPGKERARVLLQMLSERYVSVELNAGWIQKTREEPSTSNYLHL